VNRALLRCHRGASFLLSSWIALVGNASAATYFISADHGHDSNAGTREAPRKTVTGGVALLSKSGGDVLVLLDGRFETARDAIGRNLRGLSGTKSAPTTIRAAKDGAAIIAAPFELPLDTMHLRFEGLTFDHPSTKSIAGQDIGFFRCAFRGGHAAGNNSTVQVGTNDITPGASDILIEDSWIHGPGGRYKLLIYNAERVVARRVVARHDAGWIYDGRNPQGGITVYNSRHVHLQNVIVFDSELAYPGWEAGIFVVKNPDPKGVAQHTGTRVTGSLLLNLSRRAIGIEGWGNVLDAHFEDTVVWNVGDGLSLNNASHRVSVARMTMGKVVGTAYAIWRGDESRLEVKNSIISGAKRAFDRQAGTMLHSYNVCYQVRDCGGEGERFKNPMEHGLLYLPRIEKGSALERFGENRSRTGAQVIYRVGRSGTGFGQSGFDEVGSEPLWPWPNEERLKSELCDGQTGRGLCKGDQSLTTYIWSQLGKPIPTMLGSGGATR
jgi:hypothetical protein